MAEESLEWRRLRYAGTCACGNKVAAGTEAGYDRAAKKVLCASCTSTRLAPKPSKPLVEGDYFTNPVAPVVKGTAGGSARAEHQRRAKKREDRVRTTYPRLGSLLLALNDEPQHTRAWASGAYGEERVGAKLDGLEGDGVLVLHDRQVPGTRANIDHIAVGPNGVYVIDAKRYVNKDVEIRRRGGLLSNRVEALYVGGRDQTKLVVAMAGQVLSVLDAMGELPGAQTVPISPVLTFVDANVPLIGTLEIAGVRVLNMRKTAKLVRRPGPLTTTDRQRLYRQLAAALPPYQR